MGRKEGAVLAEATTSNEPDGSEAIVTGAPGTPIHNTLVSSLVRKIHALVLVNE